MNSLERARKFIAGKSAKLALSVVPLAAIAFSAIPSAQAGAITPITFSSGSCNVGSGSGVCVAAQNANPGTDVNSPWVQVFSSGAITPDSNKAISLSGGGSATGSTTTGEVIPISWDFFINSGSSSGSVFYALNIGLGGSGGGFAGTQTTAAIGSEVTGSTMITIASGGSVDDFSFSLEIFGNGFPSQQPAGFSSVIAEPPFSLTIPGGSTLDFNPGVASPSTPEPASLLLVGAGGVLLFLKKRKRA